MPDTMYISADDHMDLRVLPPDLWQSRLPAALAGQAPRVVSTPDGDFWEAEGTRWGRHGAVRSPGVPSVFERAGLPDNGLRPSTPALRLADMDRDGIYSQVIYGPPTGFPIQDPDLRIACLRAYNDWAAEFNAHAPDRLVLLAILPVTSPEAARAELERAAKLGHRGALFSFFEASQSVIDPTWEPLWAAAAETGLPISFHLGKGTHTLKLEPGTWRMPAFAAVAPMQLDEILVGTVFSGILERHPRLRLVMAECGIGWAPYLLERMDYEFHKYRPTTPDLPIHEEPSTLFRRQVYLTFQEDPVGITLIPLIGVENVMWASDYPHPDSTFPNSRQIIAETFRNVDPTIRQRVTYDNAAALYRIAAQ